MERKTSTQNLSLAIQEIKQDRELNPIIHRALDMQYATHIAEEEKCALKIDGLEKGLTITMNRRREEEMKEIEKRKREQDNANNRVGGKKPRIVEINLEETNIPPKTPTNQAITTNSLHDAPKRCIIKKK